MRKSWLAMMLAGTMSVSAWGQRANPIAQHAAAFANPQAGSTPAVASPDLNRKGDSAAIKPQRKPTPATKSPARRDAKSAAPIHIPPPPSYGIERRGTLGDYSPGAYFRNILGDQRKLWVSPEHARVGDAFWLVPMAGVGAALLGSDSAVSRSLSNSPSTLNRDSNLSWAGVGALIGAAGGLYLLGKLRHNRHEQETGFLSMESLANGLIVNNAVNLAAGRERPQVDDSRGKFWVNGRSFPSNHAVSAWSVASVMGHEYPGLLSQFLVYGLAAMVSGERVTAKQHFPADVFVGSALGWLVGQEVYRAHHDPTVGGTTWNTFSELHSEETHNPANFGSPYVLLDSWVYPAFERLESLGYVQTGMLGLRPWTRLECARLVEEAQDRLNADANPPKTAVQTYEALKNEFQRDIALLGGGSNESAELDSLYARVTGISGRPLTDGYDFGQSITNDYGRPYQEGVNAIAGFTGWATLGPLVGYVQGEYQHAPSAPSLSATALQTMASLQEIPSSFTPTALPVPGIDQFDLLNGYVGMQVGNWEISFGKQSLWWGTDVGSGMLFSNNAEPIEMLRINRVKPLRLPWILGWLGPVRGEYILGRLGGYHWLYSNLTGYTGSWTQPLSDQPYITGEKLSVRPSPNFETGFSVTTLFAGTGVPFTADSYFHALVPALPYGPSNPNYKQSGDSRGAWDFWYRIPGVRNWITLYADGFTDDQPSPLYGGFAYSAFDAGLYFPRLPKLPKLDLRVEGVYTDPPNPNPVLQHGFFYHNQRYVSGYTNDGNLIGSWIGRQGQGAQAWATYSFTPKDTLQFNFRHQKVSQSFLPLGGTLTDAGVKADFWIRSKFSVNASFQYEKWNFPILRPTPETDLTTSVQFTYWPRWRLH